MCPWTKSPETCTEFSKDVQPVGGQGLSWSRCSGPFTRTPAASRHSADNQEWKQFRDIWKKIKPQTQAGLSFLSLSYFRRIYWGQSEKNRSVKFSVSLLAFKSFAQHTLCVFIEKKRKKKKNKTKTHID